MLRQLPRIPIAQVLTVGLLPSALKVRWYRFRGYRIGRGVRLGVGSVVCGREVAIGDGTRIGFFTIVRGRTVTLGRHVHIGAMTFLDVPRIRIGDDTRINEQVFVGGLQRPDSAFEVGRNCQIMQMTFINPAVSVTIGDDSGIGGHCLVFGHTSWLSRFEGYPVDFQPITIGRSVSVAWGVFLLPGTVIEDGAVVGARAVVSRRIPARCLAVGYPARVVAREPEFPRPVPEAERRPSSTRSWPKRSSSSRRPGRGARGTGTGGGSPPAGTGGAEACGRTRSRPSESPGPRRLRRRGRAWTCW